MEKILTEVFLPAQGKCYDVYLPTDQLVQEILPRLSKMLAELSDGDFVPTGNEVLCSAEKNVTLDGALTLSQHRLKNGTRLILI